MKRDILEKTIQSEEEEYKNALQEIERLFEAEPETPDGDRLESLVALVEVYEDEHYQIPNPNYIAKVLYFLESRRWTHFRYQNIKGGQHES